MLRLSHFNKHTIKGDIFGALTSTVVALPFALAFGITSGAGASAGIYCAIITGFFASLFGGTNVQVSGPNTGLTVAMAAILTSFVAQSPDNGLVAAFTVVSLAGLFQMAFGLLKLGKYFTLVSYPVISGFTSGIGILILLSQIEPLFGVPLGDIWSQAAQLNQTNITLGLLCLALVYFWPASLSKYVPGSIAALVVATVYFVTTNVDIPVVGAISAGLPSFSMPVWDSELASEMIKSALLIATLSTLDSLMTSLTVDSITKDFHDSDQELVGQGIGNTIAGLFGALPGGGATMRTVSNLRAGGTTPLSGMLHAIFILLIVNWGGEYTAFIPSAVLAAILMNVGLNIIDWRFLKRLHQVPLFSAGLMVSTMVMSVVFDLVTAVLIGVFVANLVTIRRLSEIQLDNLNLLGVNDDGLSAPEQTLMTNIADKATVLDISGPIGFGVARGLKQCVSDSEHQVLLINLSSARFVGITSTIAIEEIITDSAQLGQKVLISGVCERVRKDFNKLKLMDKISNEHVFVTRLQALEYINDNH
ncbi:MAG: SulP family inorganic anion transporter [Psychrobium sp.]